jgi:toluene monooxygenase system protein E
MAIRPTTLVGQKTYWHLVGNRRVPSRYEIATSRLHWYTTHGLLVSSPVAHFYTKHQAGSPLRLSNEDWEAFGDPDEVTYGLYVEKRAEREIHLDQVLASSPSSSSSNGGGLSSEWVKRLDPTLSTLRYPRHALMMAAAYVGSLAPCARVTTASAFQAADETRYVHRLADRIVQLRSYPQVAVEEEKKIWLTDERWQPLRRMIEQLLVTYDWGEAFVALNTVVKPILDAATTKLTERADANGDVLTSAMMRSLAEDAAWHGRFCSHFLKHVVERRKENAEPIEAWQSKWRSLLRASTTNMENMEVPLP